MKTKIKSRQQSNELPESNSEDENKQTQEPTGRMSLMKDKKIVGLVFVVITLAVLGIYYWKFSSKSVKSEATTLKKKVRWSDQQQYNDEEDNEESWEEREARERQNYELMLQEERMAAGRDIESVMNELDRVKMAIEKNEGDSKKAKTNISEMFGDEKAGYDSFLTSMETEQSFDTAFMMKTQLDEKRQGMMDLSKELGSKHNELMTIGQQLGQQYEQMQHEYKERYGTIYIPQRVIQAKAQAESQQRMAAQRQQEMMQQQQQQAQASAPPPGFEHYAVHNKQTQAPPQMQPA
jgi:hypothetical protein